MSLLASDIITSARDKLSDSQTQGRFSDAFMLRATGEVVNRMTRRILWPESRITFATAANQQEYTGLPEIFRTLRLYVAGQLLPISDLQTIEGHQIQLYDQRGTSGEPNATGGGPPGNVGGASPLWTVQQAANYPITSELGYPAPDASPWYYGSRPRAYYRSGVLGLIPAPLGVYTVCIDCILGTGPVTSDSQTLLVPDSWLEAAAWGVASQALFSDRDAQSARRGYWFCNDPTAA